MTRPLKVGVQLPEVEREVRWPEFVDIARAIEDVGFDSIWFGDHLLYRWPDGPPAARGRRGRCSPASPPRRAGSSSGRSSPARASTTRRCSPRWPHGRRDQRRPARSSASGAGWNETEYRAFGFPFDHRIDRFEEAFTIIRTLLRDGAIDFDGRVLPGPRLRAPAARPAAGRPAAPDRLERRADAADHGPPRRRLELWYADTGNTPAGVAPLRDKVDAAARDVGRDPAAIERTVAVLVRLPGGDGRAMGDADATRMSRRSRARRR